MAKASITKRTVDAAKPMGRDHFIWDKDISGFGLKVTPAGSKTYVFQYRIARPGQAARTAAKRYTIGKHGNLTPDQARTRAKALAAMVEMGTDPRQAELDASEAEDARKTAAAEMARLVMEKYLRPALTDKPITRIDRSDLQPIIDAIPAIQRGMRRAVIAYASVLFGWAAKRGTIDRNPLAEMEQPEKPSPRDRTLSDGELCADWRATNESTGAFGSLFRLLILTEQRRSEVAELRWSELSRLEAEWTIPAERAKNKVEHIVPLSKSAVTELDRVAGRADWPMEGYVLTTTGRTPISGIGKAKRTLDDRIANQAEKDLPPWRIHDLRRTLATGLQRLGVRFEVNEAVLNHKSGARGGIAGVYQKYDWKEEKRSALEAWASHVEAILSGVEKTNVTPIRTNG